MTICQQLAAMFPELAEDFEERERLGMERYGKPLDPLADGRDWKREAREELLDSLVYLTAQLERFLEQQKNPPTFTLASLPKRRSHVIEDGRAICGTPVGLFSAVFSFGESTAGCGRCARLISRRMLTHLDYANIKEARRYALAAIGRIK